MSNRVRSPAVNQVPFAADVFTWPDEERRLLGGRDQEKLGAEGAPRSAGRCLVLPQRQTVLRAADALR